MPHVARLQRYGEEHGDRGERERERERERREREMEGGGERGSGRGQGRGGHGCVCGYGLVGSSVGLVWWVGCGYGLVGSRALQHPPSSFPFPSPLHRPPPSP
jgi:hypothetical protein